MDVKRRITPACAGSTSRVSAVCGGYASRSRDGIHDLLEIENARATIDTISDLHAGLQDGIGISGPGARRAIIAATTAPHFAGTTILDTRATHVPGPLGIRLHTNAGRLRSLADDHDRTRLTETGTP
jgi:Ca2+-binding RTX toxin-like protein